MTWIYMGIIILVVSALLLLTYAVVKCKRVSDAAKSFMWKMGFFIVLSIVPISAENVPVVDSVGRDNPIIPDPPTMIQAASIILGCPVCEEDLWRQETLVFLNISCNNNTEDLRA